MYLLFSRNAFGLAHSSLVSKLCRLISCGLAAHRLSRYVPVTSLPWVPPTMATFLISFLLFIVFLAAQQALWIRDGPSPFAGSRNLLARMRALPLIHDLAAFASGFAQPAVARMTERLLDVPVKMPDTIPVLFL